MKLELGPVDVSKTIELAAEGIQDRLATDRIRLKVEIAPDIGSFIGDESAWCRCSITSSPTPSGFLHRIPPSASARAAPSTVWSSL
ncbi:hypothetical protein BRDID11002_64490 [Bradyrhizobium diazoefficiens]